MNKYIETENFLKFALENVLKLEDSDAKVENVKLSSFVELPTTFIVHEGRSKVTINDESRDIVFHAVISEEGGRFRVLYLDLKRTI